MPHARSRDGTRIFYEAQGSGPPLILCTASFSTHRHWTGVQRALARRLRVVSWDYRGHGLSEAPEEDDRYSLARVVEDLAAVHAETADEEPAVIGGLSVGGIVGLRYALEQPDRVRALVLVNTGPGFKRPEALQAWNDTLERAAAKMERVGLEAYLAGKAASAQLMGLDRDSAASREAVAGILTSSVAGLARFARHVAGPVPNLVDELGRVKPPALILTGELDPAFQRAAEVMAARLPDATRVVLPGAGHVANLDQPEAFVREIERFLGARGWL